MPELFLRRDVAYVLWALLVLAAGGVCPDTALAQSVSPVSDDPVSFSAGSVSYDQKTGIVTATTKVEASQGDRILFADTVSYNQNSDLLVASGNVSLLEPSGEVYFASTMQLSGDMKNGIAEDMRAILTDKSRFAAKNAVRENAAITTMNRAVYSPCQPCLDEPNRPLLWQIKAVKVVHDKNRKTIEYKDAWLEFAGIPVFYTPYFSHPDPTVKRKTGFLAPSITTSSDLGVTTKTPFYWDIAPDKGATLTPILSGKGGSGASGEYRQLLTNGEFEIHGSFIHDNESSSTTDANGGTRWHMSGEGIKHLNRTWRAGAKFNRVSDDTYLRKYGFGGTGVQESKIYTEGFRDRNYMMASAYDFQDLRPDSDENNVPLILPMLEYSHQSEAGRYGQKQTLDASFVTLSRKTGTDVRRMSAEAGWEMPFLRPGGDVYSFSTSLRGDLYHVANNVTSNGTTDDGVAGRVWPQAAVGWRYPFVSNEGTSYQLLEPAASLVISPNGGNPSDIPNEDSVDFEFDDTNLFSTNRFSGLDQVEGGPRLNYGARWGIYGLGGGSSTLMVGQTFRLQDDDTFGEGTGMEDRFSDIVARVYIAPRSGMNLYYRTQLNKDNLSFRRNEIAANATVFDLNLGVNYVFFEDPPDSQFTGREQINLSASTQLSEYWSSNISSLRDLTDNGGLRSVGLGFAYNDECFNFSIDATRSFFEDRDLKPSDAITLNLVFKTLGGVSSGT